MKIFKITFFATLIAVVAYFIYIFIKMQWFIKTYKYDVKITGIDSSSFNNLLKIGTNDSWLKLSYQIIVENNSEFSIFVESMKIDFFFEDNFIGSSEHPNGVELLPNETTIIDSTGKLYFNKAAINLMANVATKREAPFSYVANVKVKGIPFTIKYKDKYTYSLDEGKDKVAIPSAATPATV